MTKINFNLLLLVLVFLTITAKAVVAVTVEGDLFEGDEKVFSVEGKDYTLRMDFIGSSSMKLTHNNELSSSIKIGESYVFADLLRFEPTKIEDWYPGGVRRARFNLSIITVCGDGVCSSSETCQADKCCNGAVKDFNTDINNCGNCNNVCASNKACTAGACSDISAGSASSCGNGICDASETCSSCNADCKCGASKRCEQSVCVTFCGNQVCETSENYENCSSDCKRQPICGDYVCEGNEDKSCCTDCGCKRGYVCSNNKCILKDECLSDSDCNDNNACTIDACLGSPKKCLNRLNETCVNATMMKNATKAITNSAIVTLKENTTKTAEKPKSEKKQSFISRLLKRLKSLFRK